MDLYCAVCNEPWDVYEIQHPGNALTEEEVKQFKQGKGCPSCRFGNGCPSCDGLGRRFGKYMRGGIYDQCERCYDKGIVHAQRGVNGRFLNGEWFTGYRPDCRVIHGTLFRRDETFMSADGLVEAAWFHCPECNPNNTGEGEPCCACDGTGKIKRKTEEFTRGDATQLLAALYDGDLDGVATDLEDAKYAGFFD